MTIQAPPGLLALAEERLLTERVTLVHCDDATLDDARSLLLLAGRMHLDSRIDPVQLAGVLADIGHALGRFSDDTRCAPPKALADAVAEFAEPCGNELCGERVAPWSRDDSFCSEPCRRAVAE